MVVTMKTETGAEIERNRPAGYAGDMPPAAESESQGDLGRPPAPEPLEAVRSFINSKELDPPRDELSSPAALGEWIEAHGLPGAGDAFDEDDLRRAIEFRESLRSFVLANNGEELEPAAVATANDIATRAHFVLRFDDQGEGGLEPDGEGIDRALGALSAIVAQSMIDGTWTRLKACRNHTCEWAFYDHSKNRSSTWCTMAVCGSRSKSREYRKRRAEHSAS
jgi:predicted RNA-binding Zn ribbon-like protein